MIVDSIICMTHLNEQQRSRARGLRSSQTIAESKLWRELRAKRFAGWKFRRQHPYGPYFLDFYCARKKVAIELDGGGHASEAQSRYDEIRSEYLQERGIRVLRFWNNDVLQQTTAVLLTIWNEMKKPLIAPLPDPLPAHMT